VSNHLHPRRTWTKREDSLIAYCYPDSTAQELADLLGRGISAVYNRAHTLGVEKSEESFKLLYGKPKLGPVATQFKKGHVPLNKGLRRPGWAPGRMAETQFKKGQVPANHLPIGSKRRDDNGYRYRKISETGCQRRDWVAIHRTLWQRFRGPIPAGHALAFKDENSDNIRIGNLELITRKELMLRNTIHNQYPKDVVNAIIMAGALKRKIREMGDGEKRND
jgi:hypothetical protein